MGLKKRICLHCGEAFKAQQSEIRRGGGKYCSRSCSAIAGSKARAKARKPLVPNVTCVYCGKPFYKSLSKFANSKSGLFFCCRKHKDLAQRIGGIAEIQPPHYKSGKYSYRKIAFRAHPHKCNRCGWDKHKGVLIVHHVDRDRSNNDPSNLEITCPTCHGVEHFLAGDGLYSNNK